MRRPELRIIDRASDRYEQAGKLLETEVQSDELIRTPHEKAVDRGDDRIETAHREPCRHSDHAALGNAAVNRTLTPALKRLTERIDADVAQQDYDLLVPGHQVDHGLGELGAQRHGFTT